MSGSSTRVLIVGAGIFGVAAAVELRDRGYEVTLLDAGAIPHPGASSTDISKMVRLDYGTDLFYTELMERALPRWRSFAKRWDRPLFHETGFIILSSEPMAQGGFEHDSYTTLKGRGHSLERVNEFDLAARFPAWSADVYLDGYFNPQGGWAESGALVSALAKEASERGVTIITEARVVALLEAQGRVCGVQLAGGQRHEADAVVIACGAWTSKLVPALSPLLTVVGQPVVHFRPESSTAFAPPDFVPWAADIATRGWYGFCDNAKGIVKVANHGPGVACDADGEHFIPEDFGSRVRSFAQRSLPGLADAAIVDDRLCLYCDSADGDFLIDRHPERPGLVVAAGGSGHGFKFMPLVGEMIADVLEGRDALPRFAWRTTAHADVVTDAARCK